MDTNKLLIFAAGVAVGYFVVNEMNKQKSKPIASNPPLSPNPNQSICEQLLLDRTMTMRMNEEDMARYKAEFMAGCLVNPMEYGAGTTATTNSNSVEDMGFPPQGDGVVGSFNMPNPLNYTTPSESENTRYNYTI